MADSPISFRDILATSKVVPFAHRGAGLLAPENTLAAFKHAIALGYPVIETDIQASRDGTLYAFHDADLIRLTGENLTIGALKDVDIDRIMVQGSHPIPKLADVFEAFPDTCFNLDAKTWPAVVPMSVLIQKMNASRRVCIGSFSEARIKAVLSHLGPDTSHSLGTAGAIRFFFAALAGLRQTFTASCVQFPVRYKGVTMINARNLEFAHRTGLKVHVWTVNDAPTMTSLLDLGVDGLMTDDCALLRSVLEQRGIWSGG